MENNNEAFCYTYNAAQQQEVEQIRSKYLPKEESKLSQLRRLDQSVYKKATVWSLVMGVLGALVMGTGMSLAMTDIGAVLGGWTMPVGIAVGLLGMGLAALAYPVYNRTLKRERQRIAPEILRLTEELMQ